MKNQNRGKKNAGKTSPEAAFGTLWKYYSDEAVSEIFIDAFDRLSVERKGRLETVPPVFASQAAVAALVKKLAALPGSNSRRTSFGSGAVLDVRLADQTVVTSAEGAAYHAVMIKKTPGRVPGWPELVKYGCVPEEAKALFEKILAQRESLLITGSSASGKTTLVNALVNGIPAGRRIVAIQAAPELVLKHPACLCLDASSDEEFTGLLRNAARFRPDHLVADSLDGLGVPEVVKAMREGLPVVASCHSDGVLDALRRLEFMYLAAKTAFGLDEIRAMLAAGLRYVSFQERGADGKRRVTDLSRIKGYEDGRYLIEPLFKYDYETGAFALTPAGREMLS
ncbi:MAG TPA: ATPase, T2SS/T4P/T4SS family [Elusimicrobiales bacterium]|nr:ATPase, T2SS/T4P/T4SS family [Elusimicrobiales bacterium]